jgi:hypothetical protein
MNSATSLSFAAEINLLHEQAKPNSKHSREALDAALAAAWRAGHLRLAEKARVRRKMGRGAWLNWLEANFRGTPRTAQRYMKLAKNVADLAFVRGLSLRQAYARLGIATEPKRREGGEFRLRLPAPVVLANKLLRALKRQAGGSPIASGPRYGCDLRPLYEQLRAWFEPMTVPPKSLDFPRPVVSTEES